MKIPGFSILLWWQNGHPEVIHVLQIKFEKIIVLAFESCTAATALFVVFPLGVGGFIFGCCSIFFIYIMLLKDFFKNVKVKPTTSALVSSWETLCYWSEKVIKWPWFDCFSNRQSTELGRVLPIALLPCRCFKTLSLNFSLCFSSL